MKVLIITYYWPPAGGSGVQRWLKFVKYLRDFDIEPVIYTVDNPAYVIEDASLLADIPEGVEVIRQPIFEPNSILSFFGKKNKKQSGGFLNPNPSAIGKLLQYIRANYFIPDARKYWIRPSVKYLEQYVRENDIDAVISTGPPHSMHLIAMQLKERTGMTWISDFRDPWTEIDYFHQLPLSKRSKLKHIELEEQVVSKSDVVIVVGETMKKNFEKYNDEIHVVTNGYDSKVSELNEELDMSFTITHIGMMNADRNPTILWSVLKEICDENADFKKDLKVQLIGKVATEVEKDLASLNEKNIALIEYLDHQDARLYQQRSQLLLLAINNVPSAKGIITGKIFEYLQARRPILGIGPIHGDAANIVNETTSGIMVDFDDAAGLKGTILEYYDKFKKGDLTVSSSNIEKYHRKELTRELSVILIQD
ncbi:glycosyltransferase [Flavobacteriaceae bacterium S356]|uniref:Glycosyltransferase n=1 Tax=Asprobacillus argus TaxID=3076534 RepID=A0ABU3LJU1_9FLAO|nr:glycosyltransferase [Flavobacteriaceae bacterium S356]